MQWKKSDLFPNYEISEFGDVRDAGAGWMFACPKCKADYSIDEWAESCPFCDWSDSDRIRSTIGESSP